MNWKLSIWKINSFSGLWYKILDLYWLFWTTSDWKIYIHSCIIHRGSFIQGRNGISDDAISLVAWTIRHDIRRYAMFHIRCVTLKWLQWIGIIDKLYKSVAVFKLCVKNDKWGHIVLLLRFFTCNYFYYFFSFLSYNNITSGTIMMNIFYRSNYN